VTVYFQINVWRLTQIIVPQGKLNTEVVYIEKLLSDF